MTVADYKGSRSLSILKTLLHLSATIITLLCRVVCFFKRSFSSCCLCYVLDLTLHCYFTLSTLRNVLRVEFSSYDVTFSACSSTTTVMTKVGTLQSTVSYFPDVFSLKKIPVFLHLLVGFIFSCWYARK